MYIIHSYNVCVCVCVCVCMYMLIHVLLFVSLVGSSAYGIFQAKILEQVAIS